MTAFEVTNDSYIYGYWTVTQLEPDAYVVIEKLIYVDGVLTTDFDAAEDVWFRIDPGADKDGDGTSQVDVDYSAIAAAGGAYQLPVYQFETPFTFAEHNTAVPGYTWSVNVAVSGTYADLVSSDAAGNATVSFDAVYDEDVNLGTVTYSNYYTKNVGTPVSEYPVLTLRKNASDTMAPLAGAEFTLYNAAGQSVGTYTTDADGYLHIAFTGMAAGDYTLKETKAPAGYELNDTAADVYTITLTAGTPVEELRDNEFVMVTEYSVAVRLPADANAVMNGSTLHVYDDPILGSISLSKETEGMADADLSKIAATVILHGPITRDASGAIADIGETYEQVLYSTGTITFPDLPLGEYLLHESFASVHGYTWTGATYGSFETVVYNGITSALIKLTDVSHDASFVLTNKYEEWSEADLWIRKYASDRTTLLAGAEFTMYYGNEVVAVAVTGADGYAHIVDGELPSSLPEGVTEAVFTLKETKAPAGYYMSSLEWTVTLSLKIDNNGKSYYDYDVTLVGGGAAEYNGATDLLTVYDEPILGTLDITKIVKVTNFPEDEPLTSTDPETRLASIDILVSGPNGYSETFTITAENDWKLSIYDLPLGEYTIVELGGNVPGYTLVTTYQGDGEESTSAAVVTLAVSDNSRTTVDVVPTASATITNKYSRNQETYGVPTMLRVLKVDENGDPLPGATFQLKSADGEFVEEWTGGTNGVVVFDMLHGTVDTTQDPPTPTVTEYTLREVSAPEGYTASSETWTVTVTDEDGKVRIVFNENKNIFENFWDWITGMDHASWDQDSLTLTVPNTRKTANLTVEKVVMSENTGLEDESYSFTIVITDADGNAWKTENFTLKHGEKKTFEDVPYGSTYTLTENVPVGAAYAPDQASYTGTTTDTDATVTVTNTYEYTYEGPEVMIELVKTDAETGAGLEGARFAVSRDAAMTDIIAQPESDENGKVVFCLYATDVNGNYLEEVTYYVAETQAPEGYVLDDTVYEVTLTRKARLAANGGYIEYYYEVSGDLTDKGYEVENERDVYDLVVSKTVRYWDIDTGLEIECPESGLESASYSFTVVILDAAGEETLNETFTLKDGEEKTFGSIPYGYSYTVTENVPEDALYLPDQAEFEDEIGAQDAAVEVVNNYYYANFSNEEGDDPIGEISFTKVDSETGAAVQGAEFTLYTDAALTDAVATATSDANGVVHFTLPAKDATYYMTETAAPAGYHATDAVYSFKTVLTEEVEDLDGRDVITLTLTVEDCTIPAVNGAYQVANTPIKPVEVSVKKLWYGGEDVVHPESVDVVLYRDGEKYDTVTLSADNGWQHTWTGLTDEYQWTVDEAKVPTGYSRRIAQNGYSFTITNYHSDIPKTGDGAMLAMWGGIVLIALIGMILVGTKMGKKPAKSARRK